MSDGLRIYRGGLGDQAFVRDLGRRVARTSLPSGREADEQNLVAGFERLAAFVYSESHVLLIAAEGERRVGFLLLLDALPDEVTLVPQAFVAYMAVEPGRQRHGIGRALLQEAEQIARAQGRDRIALMVTETNAAARSLYERSGFTTDRRLLSKPL